MHSQVYSFPARSRKRTFGGIFLRALKTLDPARMAPILAEQMQSAAPMASPLAAPLAVPPAAQPSAPMYDLKTAVANSDLLDDQS